MPRKEKKSLVIVESPTKARTIARFLGSDFIVDSSYGHVRDLPTSTLGVDPEDNFAPHYIIPKKATATVKRLKAAAAKAGKIILATDEDREGEAIAWHLLYALGIRIDHAANARKEARAVARKKAKQDAAEAAGIAPAENPAPEPITKKEPPAALEKPVERIVFHEITEHAIKEALLHPRALDEHLVDAQQARRILDRLVGYKLSPFLWKKLYRGLSAGRVQSVAVRFVVEREREIQKFNKEEYWTIEADLIKKEAHKNAEPFHAALVNINGKVMDKFAIRDGSAAERIAKELEDAAWHVASVEKRASVKHPLPPFTTSTLQQEAFRRLGFSARATMAIAQQLYEGVDLGGAGAVGLITYMRTDSLTIGQEAMSGTRRYIETELGKHYLVPTARRFKTKSKGAQEAHEAIRPTDPLRTPRSVESFLDKRQHKLYDLIWRRTVATQMADALFDATSVDIAATPRTAAANAPSYLFRATGQTMKFDGFLKLYPTKFTEITLPDLAEHDPLTPVTLSPLQHFTEPPPRYTEASLIKLLEQNGIGRPSTYAPTIATIQDRHYVERDERRRLIPTETGYTVNDMLVEHFPQIVDSQFTAKMEEEFDEIAEGTISWQPVIREFYEPFAALLETKYEHVEKQDTDETTDEMCEKCGKPMIIKRGRFGKFLACSGFPECKNAKAIKKDPETIGMKCPVCTEGEVIKKFTRRKRMFYGCSRYPACDFASWKDPRAPAEEAHTPEPSSEHEQAND